MAEPYFNKEPWCPRDASDQTGTAPWCISMRDCIYVYQYVLGEGLHCACCSSSGPSSSYFNKERRCPVYFNKELWCPGLVSVSLGLHLGVLVWGILQVSEWQIGDYHDDGNMWVKVERNQYGRSFTRSLQGTNCCIEEQCYRGWILRKGGNLGLVLLTLVSGYETSLAQLQPFFFSLFAIQVDYS